MNADATRPSRVALVLAKPTINDGDQGFAATLPPCCPRKGGQRSAPALERARPHEGCLRPARPLGRRPPLLARSPHELRHEPRNGGGRPRRQAHHGQRPAAGRWPHAGGYPPVLPPRTIPAPALRSPPPTTRRPAGQLRSASAENPHLDFSQRSMLGPCIPRKAGAARVAAGCACRRAGRSASRRAGSTSGRSVSRCR